MDVARSTTTADIEDILKVINAEHHDPFCVLGIHKVKTGFAIRTCMPNAKSISVVAVSNGDKYPMEKVHEWGFFEAIMQDKKSLFKYKLEVTDYFDNIFTIFDPYSFPRFV